MWIIRLIAVLIAASFIPVMAQTTTAPSNATVALTITAPHIPATVKATLSTSTVQAGGTASVTVAVSGSAGTPTVSIELQVQAPGTTTYTTLNTFTPTGGNVVYTYPIPVTAPPGVYSLKAIYIPPTGGIYY